MRKKHNDLVSVKLPRAFAIWLKVEAAKKSIPMYELLEAIASRGKERPWKIYV